MPHPLTRHRLAAALLSASVVGLPLAHATETTAPATVESTRQYAIAAGSLTEVLSRFASASGVALSFDAAQTNGRQSSGLHGSYSVSAGFATLLAGSGLRVIDAGGSYVLEKVVDNGAALELGATSVNAAALGAVTEGTNAYTTGSTSTATKMNLSIRETPQSISVITRQRMDDQQLNSVTDVLNQTPGITMSQDGGERFNIYSRGSAINTYQFDGVTTTQENQTRNMPSTLLDMALYDRVEIVRGATGLMTGAGEPSGVVNLIRKRPTRDFKAYAQANIGSWDYYRGEFDVAGPLTDSGNVRGRFVTVKQDNHTFMDWYGQKRELFYGTVETDLSETTLLRFGIDYQKYRSTGSPGVPLLFTNGQPTDFSRSTSSGARWAYDDYETLNYTLNLEQQLAHDWQLKVAANYMDVDRDSALGWYRSTSGRSYLNQQTGIGSAELGAVSANQIQKGIDVMAQGPFELLGRSHELVAGFNFSEYENRHDSSSGGTTNFNFYTWENELAAPAFTPALVFNIDTRQTGYFLASRFNLTDRLHLIVGARGTDYSYDYYLKVVSLANPTAYSMRESGEVTPYAGLVYDLSEEQSVYASYTDIFKPQSNRDRSGRVLEPVVGKNYELGWKGEFLEGRVNANAAVYWIKRDNYAEQDGTVESNPSETAYRAVKGAQTKGIDLELSGEVIADWNVQAGYSHSRTENAEGVRQTTQLPLDTLRLWTTYRLPGDWQQLTVGGGVSWNSSQSLYYSNYSSRISQEDYAVVNLMSRYRFNEHLAATLNLNNLFDEKYYAGMAGSYGHYGAPRNAMLNLRYDF